MLENAQLSSGRQQLNDRIHRFITATKSEELRSLMRRLKEIVIDRDCSEEIVPDCKELYGLSGEELKMKLISLLDDHESMIVENRIRRDRLEALRLSKDLSLSNQLRDFYFSLSVDDLDEIWNGGENQLSENERTLVRIAIRDKLGIAKATGDTPQVCGQCCLPKSSCVCERSWW